MATFAWAESPGTAVENELRVSSTKFGDGYEEVAAAGLNPLAQKWTVTFRAVADKEGSQIEDFFRARMSAAGELEAFDWWPLWAKAAIKVRCRTWSRTQSTLPDESDISATFERVYLP